MNFWNTLLGRKDSPEPLIVECPFCKQPVTADKSLAGVTVSCPNTACRRDFLIPADLFQNQDRPASKSPTKLGPPSATLRQFRTDIAERGEFFELSGQWLDEIFPGRSSVQVMKRGDVKAFLAGADDKFKWIIAYMHHPDPAMLAQTLDAAAPLSQLATVENLAYLVTHGDRKLEDVAVKYFWRVLGESSFNIFFNVLGSGGILPSGIDHARAKWAVSRIYAECPTDCALSKKADFEQMAQDRFGPSVLKSSSGGATAKSKPQVKYKETTRNKGPLGDTNTYEVYTGQSKSDALAFLETKNITKSLYFIVVETPEGNWCKDKGGIYQE